MYVQKCLTYDNRLVSLNPIVSRTAVNLYMHRLGCGSLGHQGAEHSQHAFLYW